MSNQDVTLNREETKLLKKYGFKKVNSNLYLFEDNEDGVMREYVSKHEDSKNGGYTYKVETHESYCNGEEEYDNKSSEKDLAKYLDEYREVA